MIKSLPFVLLMIAVVACNTTDGGPPIKEVKIFAEDPYVTGEITDIDWKRVGEDSLFTILVRKILAFMNRMKWQGIKCTFFCGIQLRSLP